MRFERYDQGTPCWIELATSDPPAAEVFYGGLFGWTVDDPGRQESEHGLVFTLSGDEMGGLARLPASAVDDPPAYWSVYLACDDVAAATSRVVGAGGAVESGPVDVGGHGRASYVRDPAGARVHLWQAGHRIGTRRANETATPVWNEVRTDDVVRAGRFYAEILGMGTGTMPVAGGDYTTLTDARGRVIGGAAGLLPEIPTPHWNVYFYVDDVDAAAASAAVLGGGVRIPPHDLVGVGRLALVHDGQGALFWVMNERTGPS